MTSSPHRAPSAVAALGGARTIEAVVHRFYGKVFCDPILAPFFRGVDRARQEQRLTAFICMAAEEDWMAGFHREFLRGVHGRLNVTEEAFARRRTLLCDAAAEEGLGAEAVAKWVEFDERWRTSVLGHAADTVRE